MGNDAREDIGLTPSEVPSMLDKWLIGIMAGLFGVAVIVETLHGNLAFIEMWFSWKVLVWVIDFIKEIVNDN